MHSFIPSIPSIIRDYSNPTPGEIINHPDGGDVYANVPTDYTGSAVTVDTFFKVLRGDAEGLNGVGSGKVVNAGPNDRIFINMDDHGSPGLFCFPYDNMYAEDFANVVLEMKENNKFGEVGSLHSGPICLFSYLSLFIYLINRNRRKYFRVFVTNINKGKLA